MAGMDADQAGTLRPRFRNHRSGFYPKRFSLVTGGNGAGSIGLFIRQRGDRYRLAAQVPVQLLLNTGEEAVEIEKYMRQVTWRFHTRKNGDCPHIKTAQ
jgi:hypothetical protein